MLRIDRDHQKVESYGFAAKSIDEIGRLIGDWLRSRPEGTETTAEFGTRNVE